ncbi:DNA/RNA non-specific endonuclease, partial [Pseudomonas syringae pv. tagetis]|uniref:DNA/RNA non-specific endonuclease n=1 Tax=Pseudomonas syringae group genomosp. 7 TaxID=251699 RepID=UPI00376F8D43
YHPKTRLDLEHYILETTRRSTSRLTVITGPVLRDDDRSYRNVKIPSAFWKVVAFLGDAGKPSASAYMIDLSRELGKLEII